MSGPSREAIRAEALRIGFAACGFARLDPSRRADALDRWLAAGYAGTMRYLHRQKKKRKAPAAITPGARSAVVLLENYTAPPEERHRPGDRYRIASYARGMDYHLVSHGRLHRLSEWMKAQGAELAHTWIDDSPVPERELAERAGLGWIGKNTMLIHPRIGSWTFIGTIFTSLELEPDQDEVSDHCGRCTRCLDACPTEAFVAARELDATRCLSYLTIECRDEAPAELQPRMADWAFGCDICNEVCPWNIKFAVPTTVDDFARRAAPDRSDVGEFDTMDEATFRQHFADTPLARPGLERMRRNVRIATAARREDQ